MYGKHRRQIALRCSKANRSKRARAITASSQSHSKPQRQAHKTANTLLAVQEEAQDCAIRQKTVLFCPLMHPQIQIPFVLFSISLQKLTFKRLAQTATRQVQRPGIGTFLQPVVKSPHVVHLVAKSHKRTAHMLKFK